MAIPSRGKITWSAEGILDNPALFITAAQQSEGVRQAGDSLVERCHDLREEARKKMENRLREIAQIEEK
jgi:hypothetical protein